MYISAHMSYLKILGAGMLKMDVCTQNDCWLKLIEYQNGEKGKA